MSNCIHVKYSVSHYKLGTLSNLPRAYENEELHEMKHFVLCFSFELYRNNKWKNSAYGRRSSLSRPAYKRW